MVDTGGSTRRFNQPRGRDALMRWGVNAAESDERLHIHTDNYSHVLYSVLRCVLLVETDGDTCLFGSTPGGLWRYIVPLSFGPFATHLRHLSLEFNDFTTRFNSS